MRGVTTKVDLAFCVEVHRPYFTGGDMFHWTCTLQACPTSLGVCSVGCVPRWDMSDLGTQKFQKTLGKIPLENSKTRNSTKKSWNAFTPKKIPEARKIWKNLKKNPILKNLRTRNSSKNLREPKIRAKKILKARKF